MPSLLPSIDLQSYQNETSGLSPKELAYVGAVTTKVDDSTLDTAFDFVQRTLGTFDTYLDVTAVTSIDEITSLLNAGATKVIADRAQVDALSKVGTIEQDRLILIATDGDGIFSNESYAKFALYTRSTGAEQFASTAGKNRPAIYIALDNSTPEDARRVAAIGGIPIISATALTMDAKTSPGLISVAELLLANAKSDRPDGLFTTLVTDERGVALGLVYSNAESVAESLRIGRGVYHSRKRGLWYKGESSGDIQELVRVELDCDSDCLSYTVRQKGRGFCHLATPTCFGQYQGLSKLQKTLVERKASAPEGSYTARLFNDEKLLHSKILEEANELVEAKTKQEIAFEAADVFYFALTKCIAAGVSLEDVERSLDAKSFKVKRRRGDAKPQFAAQVSQTNGTNGTTEKGEQKEMLKEAASVPKKPDDPAGVINGRIQMRRVDATTESQQSLLDVLKRPSQRATDKIMGIVNPIVERVRTGGDAAVLEFTHKFEKATSLKSPVLKAPFPPELMQLPPETIEAIDVSFENIRKFHAAQQETKPLVVETMPGVVCSRFARPIERVGLYVPGGTAVLPSSALMLGVPAMVAGCHKIVLATPPRADGSLTPEVVYAAHKVGAGEIVLAGGAQAVAAMAYGTESITKVDKILGPGNQFVTAAKMLVSNDTTAGVSIDMPAGPSEVLVVADKTANPAFVASDLLSQAEHGVDSQVICIAVGLTEKELLAIEDELDRQANALPRVDIVRGAISHSVTLSVKTIEEAMDLSNEYAPEHLILQVDNAEKVVDLVTNAGSVFIGPWTPESVGDYSAGVNHSLPTYGYAKQYSGVNLGSYIKHITSSNLTKEGLERVGPAVMQLAKVEQLEAHRRAVSIRLGTA